MEMLWLLEEVSSSRIKVLQKYIVLLEGQRVLNVWVLICRFSNHKHGTRAGVNGRNWQTGVNQCLYSICKRK